MTTRQGSGPTAFVLDINVFGGLGAVRSLARAGVPVVGLGVDPNRFGFASRYCRPLQCPNPVTQPEELLRFFLSEGRQLAEPGILLPASDEFALFLWRYRDELREYFRFSTCPPDIMEAGVNKRKQYDLAEQLGVPYPATCYPEDMDEVHRIKDQLDYPVFIKPCYSHLWRARFPKFGKGIKVHTSQELVGAFREILPSGVQVMVQSIIPGPNSHHVNVRAYIGESGETLGVFTSRKLRQYPVQFGVGTMAESISDPELLELGLRYFRGTGFRGFGYIEFKRDSRDGKPKMIELNVRFSAQIIHSTDCGMNFPLIQYLDLAGRTPPPQTTYKTGVRWLSSVGDLRSGWEHMRSGQLSPWSWLRSWAGARSFAVFALDDLKPFLKYVVTLPSKKHHRPIASESAGWRDTAPAATPAPPSAV
ncbi:MAG: D-aspartate ligase [Thermomicrobiales bacterium]|nr:D-aspartate ligase [Thermomicrobiales bacterium]